MEVEADWSRRKDAELHISKHEHKGGVKENQGRSSHGYRRRFTLNLLNWKHAWRQPVVARRALREHPRSRSMSRAGEAPRETDSSQGEAASQPRWTPGNCSQISNGSYLFSECYCNYGNVIWSALPRKILVTSASPTNSAPACEKRCNPAWHQRR